VRVITDGRSGYTEVVDADRRFRFAHLPDAAIKVARLPSGAYAAVADRAGGRDRSWGSSLLVASVGRDGEGRDAAELCDRVFYASTPMALPDGTVLVERGRSGAVVPGLMRVDELTLDRVDPASGRATTIWSGTGFEAHLAALAGDEVIVYLIQPDVASLVAVDWRTGRARVILPSLPPYAHDFAIDSSAGAQTLTLHNRDDVRRDLETVERIDLYGGNRTRLETR
jgi:hypothetical protein